MYYIAKRTAERVLELLVSEESCNFSCTRMQDSYVCAHETSMKIVKAFKSIKIVRAPDLLDFVF